MNTGLIGLLVLPVLLMFSIGCTEKVVETDFEKVCGYFQLLAQHENVEHMSPEQRDEFIMLKIEEGLPANSNARVAWQAIVSAVPEQRYELFKSAAESVYPLPFDCEAMARLAPVTGN